MDWSESDELSHSHRHSYSVTIVIGLILSDDESLLGTCSKPMIRKLFRIKQGFEQIESAGGFDTV